MHHKLLLVEIWGILTDFASELNVGGAEKSSFGAATFNFGLETFILRIQLLI